MGPISDKYTPGRTITSVSHLYEPPQRLRSRSRAPKRFTLCLCTWKRFGTQLPGLLTSIYSALPPQAPRRATAATATITKARHRPQPPGRATRAAYILYQRLCLYMCLMRCLNVQPPYVSCTIWAHRRNLMGPMTTAGRQNMFSKGNSLYILYIHMPQSEGTGASTCDVTPN